MDPNSNQHIKLNKYKTLHKWMIIPMVFMQLGIFRDYWGDFSDNAWDNQKKVHFIQAFYFYNYPICL